ncbi:protein translocase subunit SecF [Peptostreptococcaceae bacterium AGR-M142]
MKIIEKKKIWFSLSIAIMIIGLALSLTRGLNYGIDFTGGTQIEINVHKEFSVDEVREITNKYDKDMSINKIGDKKEIVQLKTREDLDSKKREELFNSFKEKYNLTEANPEKVDQFGPSVGDEIKNKALVSVIIATIGILIYLSFRFELSYGVAAVIALVHDVLIVLAVYAIFNIPVNAPFVAAMLTVVGYSINDTIVVFDRIRENLKYNKKKSPYMEVANESIGQTISRSINTSLTTLVAIGSLYFLASESIKDFLLPLIGGVLTGTYSSIFIASPIWVLIKNKKKNKNAKIA